MIFDFVRSGRMRQNVRASELIPQSEKRSDAEKKALRKQRTDGKRGEAAMVGMADVDGPEAELLDMEVQLAAAKCAWLRFKETGFRSKRALQLLDNFFCSPGQELVVQAPRPPSLHPSVHQPHQLHQATLPPPPPPPQQQQQQQLQSRRHRGRVNSRDDLRSLEADTFLGAHDQPCLSRTKAPHRAAVAAAAAVANPSSARSFSAADRVTPSGTDGRDPARIPRERQRPADSSSSTGECTRSRQPLKFKEWAAEYARAVAAGHTARALSSSLQPNEVIAAAGAAMAAAEDDVGAAMYDVAAATPGPLLGHASHLPCWGLARRWLDSQQQQQQAPPSAGLSPVAEPLRTIPYSQWVRDVLSLDDGFGGTPSPCAGGGSDGSPVRVLRFVLPSPGEDQEQQQQQQQQLSSLSLSSQPPSFRPSAVFDLQPNDDDKEEAEEEEEEEAGIVYEAECCDIYSHGAGGDSDGGSFGTESSNTTAGGRDSSLPVPPMSFWQLGQ
ncbi:hypothetical protein VOLCADRAFT_88011 [Volvox carteri f. nagariensis]|uniref:Uncharacterized protein n=1 Tax=Volvox carteri f. nagariensis TaxID=3068 RepID=D8TMU4_VOLCA|nr:uncharacterized protein VOLCADRAFT_88011 [Volvox carteri f. nagariensis]EFJ51186.1 hypothetical protein VOLCADRAFT_88011 [Volvox carteri f. nagariensis]|eukprot:XP_002947653.1 hypothetical protein VOLCADRAFT_88011 [Volvox carteri f. nagariensis]